MNTWVLSWLPPSGNIHIAFSWLKALKTFEYKSLWSTLGTTFGINLSITLYSTKLGNSNSVVILISVSEITSSILYVILFISKLHPASILVKSVPSPYNKIIGYTWTKFFVDLNFPLPLYAKSWALETGIKVFILLRNHPIIFLENETLATIKWILLGNKFTLTIPSKYWFAWGAHTNSTAPLLGIFSAPVIFAPYKTVIITSEE